MSFALWDYFAGLFYVQVKGLDAIQVMLRYLPQTIGGFVGGISANYLLKRVSTQIVFCLGWVVLPFWSHAGLNESFFADTLPVCPIMIVQSTLRCYRCHHFRCCKLRRWLLGACTVLWFLLIQWVIFFQKPILGNARDLIATHFTLIVNGACFVYAS
jgi:hypothetical protein